MRRFFSQTRLSKGGGELYILFILGVVMAAGVMLSGGIGPKQQSPQKNQQASQIDPTATAQATLTPPDSQLPTPTVPTQSSPSGVIAPDLIVEEFKLVDRDGQEKTTFVTGEPIYVKVTNNNIGDLQGFSNNGLYTWSRIYSNSPDTVQPGDDSGAVLFMRNGQYSVGQRKTYISAENAQLNPGPFRWVFSWTQTTPGTYTARYFLNYDHSVPEKNYENNQLTVQYTIAQGSAPTATPTKKPTPSPTKKPTATPKAQGTGACGSPPRYYSSVQEYAKAIKDQWSITFRGPFTPTHMKWIWEEFWHINCTGLLQDIKGTVVEGTGCQGSCISFQVGCPGPADGVVDVGMSMYDEKATKGIIAHELTHVWQECTRDGEANKIKDGNAMRIEGGISRYSRGECGLKPGSPLNEDHADAIAYHLNRNVPELTCGSGTTNPYSGGRYPEHRKVAESGVGKSR